MTLFLLSVIMLLLSLIVALFLYLRHKIAEEKKEQEAIKEKYKTAAEVYENEKKNNENIINTIDPDNVADKLQDLAEKGNKRLNRPTK